MDKQEYYIIRGDRSGVFFGRIKSRDGREITIGNARRIWYWAGAASLSQLAKEGTKSPSECRFTVTVPELTILDAIEIIPCSSGAAACINGVKEWKM